MPEEKPQNDVEEALAAWLGTLTPDELADVRATFDPSRWEDEDGTPA